MTVTIIDASPCVADHYCWPFSPILNRLLFFAGPPLLALALVLLAFSRLLSCLTSSCLQLRILQEAAARGPDDDAELYELVAELEAKLMVYDSICLF
jgi:hypothetical protein